MTFMATIRLALRGVSCSHRSSSLHTSSLLFNLTTIQQQWPRSPCSVQPFLVTANAQRGFMRTKMSERALRRKNLRKMKSQKGGKVPMLKDILRKLYMRTHPDLFGRYPEQQRTNEESYKELLGILDAIEKHNAFPPARVLLLPFYLKTSIEGEFKEVNLEMRTTGGACNTLVEEALGRFFGECGLPQAFQWNEGSWGKVVGKEAVENSNLNFDKDEEECRETESAAKRETIQQHYEPAFNPDDSGTTMEDVSVERVLSELNDVFEIIAAVPLMDEEEYGELREHFEKGNGLDEVDERGYTIKAGTHKIWKGERDLKKVIDGVDTDSALILQRILLHTVNIERKVREMIANGGIDPDEGVEPEKSSNTN